MKVAALIQASSKGVNTKGLPTNALEEVKGKPLLWHLIERVKRAKKVDEIVVVTTGNEEDRVILEIAKECNISSIILNDDTIYNDDLWGGQKVPIFYYYGIDCIGLLMEISEQLKTHTVVLMRDDQYLGFIDPSIIDQTITSHFEGEEYITVNTGNVGIDYLLVSSPHRWKEIYNRSRKEIENKESVQKRRIHLTEFFTDYELISKTNKTSFLVTNKVSRGLTLGAFSKQKVALIRKIYDQLYHPGEIINSIDVIKLLNECPEFLSDIITTIEIEVTNDCNLKCIMCLRTEKMTREIGYMDFDLFKKIIGETEASSIHFSGLGEPLLHPQIKEMFAYAKEKKLEVGLWTNGVNLDENLSREIIEEGLLDYIIFGLDGATKETYAKVKGIDCFDKAVENITRFLKLKKEKVAGIAKNIYGWWSKVESIIGVQILKTKETDAEIEEFMEKWDFQEKAKKTINYRNRIQKDSGVNIELWETLYNKFSPLNM